MSDSTTVQARKLYAKINRRAQRLVKAGATTSALGEFLALGRLARGEKASRTYLNRLKALDRQQGLNARGAKIAIIDEARELKRVTAAAYRAKASTKSLARAANLSTKVLRAKYEVVSRISEDSAHLRRTGEAIASARPAQGDAVNALRAKLATSTRLLGYKSLTEEGATRALENAREIFGSEYDEWSTEQKSAAWEAFSRQKESLGSPTAMEVIGTAARANFLEFITDSKGRLRAVIGTDPEDAASKAARDVAHKQVVQRMKPKKPAMTVEQEQELLSESKDFLTMTKANNARLKF